VQAQEERGVDEGVHVGHVQRDLVTQEVGVAVVDAVAARAAAAPAPAGGGQGDEEQRTPEEDVCGRDDHEHAHPLHAVPLHAPDVVADAAVRVGGQAAGRRRGPGAPRARRGRCRRERGSP
jgi:hypothetical protein